MQELRDEMDRRIKTLDSHVAHCESERLHLLDQVAGYDQQIKDEKALAAQYREALHQLAVTVTYHA